MIRFDFDSRLPPTAFELGINEDQKTESPDGRQGFQPP
jgi:hypothetical protein